MFGETLAQRMRRAVCLAAGLLALAVLAALPARAHFKLNINLRIIHVAHVQDGLRVLIRLPMPYVVANLLGPELPDGTRTPAPYTTNRIENGQLMHYLDASALRRAPEGLGKLVAKGHNFVVDGQRLGAEVEAVRAYPALSQPPFATLDEASAALKGVPYEPQFKATYVGDTVLDVALLYRTPGTVTSYEFSSTLNPGLKQQDETANLLLDYFPGGTKVFRARGLLAEPLTITRSAFRAALTFIKEGVRHILEGRDHVLFVLCLVLGATSIGALLWRVTGFTLGHTVTLMAGFFGLVPSGDWFVPLVETGIALSIIYAAMAALMAYEKAATFFVAAAIGLLHGLGFSFVLHEILRVDAPNIWQSLLSFNLGVELGQLGIVLATWPLFRLIAARSEKLWLISRWGIAVPCIAVAAMWTGQRAISVLQAL